MASQTAHQARQEGSQEGRHRRGQGARLARHGNRPAQGRAGKVIPRKILNKFTCTVNGKQVFAADFEPAISANPYIQFKFKAAGVRPGGADLDRRRRLQDRRRRDDHGQLGVAASFRRHEAWRSAPEAWLRRRGSGSLPARVPACATGSSHDLQARLPPGRRRDGGARAGRLDARLRAAAADAGRAAARSSRSATSRWCTSPTSTPSSCRCFSASRRSISASARRKGQVAAHHRRATSSTSTASRPARAAAYALTSEDFAALAKSYGRIGGLDRIATVLKAIRAERGDRVLLLDGGDTWQNSYTSHADQGPGHGRLHGAAEARRHDRPLGVHARRRAREGDRRRARLSVPRAEHPRHRMERSRRSSRRRCSSAAASRSR